MQFKLGVIIACDRKKLRLSKEARIIMNNSIKQGPDKDRPVLTRRRRLLTGTAAGAGVFLAMQAKTALGGTCQSPSAMLSGNQSHPHDSSTCWGGRSPGFWKQPGNRTNWNGLTFPTFKSGVKISDCQNGVTGVSPCDLATRGTALSTIFTGAPAGFGAWEVLVWPTNYPGATNVGTATCTLNGSNGDVFGGKGQLLRHLVAAYLNAGAGQGYPITQTQVVAMWNAVKGGGVYYPSGSSGAGLTADGVKSYIENMYHSGVGDNLEGCQKE